MRFECSYSDINGLTVSLTVSVDQSFFEPSSPIELGQDEVQHLTSSSFEKCLSEITGQLVSAHHAVEQALNVSVLNHFSVEVGQ